MESSGASQRIFTDVVRLWAVCEQSELDATVARIYSSYLRGAECLVRKRLRGIESPSPSEPSVPSDEKADPSSSSRMRLPATYTEVAVLEALKPESQSKRKKKKGKQVALLEHELQLPAAAGRGGSNRHLLKFYDFDTVQTRSFMQRARLVQDPSDTLQDTSTSTSTPQTANAPVKVTETESPDTLEIEFPFRLTEMEYFVVNLNPRPEEPIILLGRSGTGKTTCCLYRMFSQFVTYWFRAKKAGRPLIPRPTDRDRSNSIEYTEKNSANDRAPELSSGFLYYPLKALSFHFFC